MSLSALTTAMAVAAATVPDSGAQAPVAAINSDSVVLDYDLPEAGPAAESIEASQSLLAQSTASPQSTEPAQSAEPATSTDATSPVQSESQSPAPPAEQPDIIVTGRRRSPDDPLEEINDTSYGVAVAVDESIVAPIAFAYEDVMPRPVRKGLSNFLHNLGEPIVFLNFLLQLKPDKAAETLARFAINTTLGVGGVVDVAKRKPFNLPYRHNGFANTLGYYGMKPGPYFYLPLIGPTTLRDFIGDRLDLLVVPSIIGNQVRDPKIVVPIFVLKELGRRIEIKDEVNEVRATQDPYLTTRTHYLKKRQAEIDALHGRAPSTAVPTAPVPASIVPRPVPSPSTPVQNPVPRPDPPRQ